MEKGKFSKELIEKGRWIFKQGGGVLDVMRHCGLKDESKEAIYYHFFPNRKTNQLKYSKDWKRLHPERAGAIQKKANAKHYKKLKANK